MTAQGPNGVTYGAGYEDAELDRLGRAAWQALTGHPAPRAPISAGDAIKNPLQTALAAFGTDGPAVRGLAQQLGVTPHTVYRWKRTGRISEVNRQHLEAEARTHHTERVRARRRKLLSGKRFGFLDERWARRGASDRGTLNGKVRKSNDTGVRNLYVGRWQSPFCQYLLSKLARAFRAGASITELGDVIATAIDSELNEEHAFHILGPMHLDL